MAYKSRLHEMATDRLTVYKPIHMCWLNEMQNAIDCRRRAGTTRWTTVNRTIAEHADNWMEHARSSSLAIVRINWIKG